MGIEDVTESTRILEILHGLSLAASGLVDEASLATLTVQAAAELVAADGALLRWYQPDTGTLRLLAIDADRKVAAPLDVAPGRSVLGNSFLGSVPVVSNDHQHDINVDPSVRLPGVTAMMAVPLLVGDRALGALGVFRARKRGFSSADVRLLTLLGAQVAASIEAARLISDMTSQEKSLKEDAARLKRSEEVGAASLSLLRHSQSIGDIGTFVGWIGADRGDLAEWSDTALRIFGYTAETFGATRQSFWQGVHPDDLAKVRASQEAALATDAAFDIRHRIIRKDGQVRWIHTRAGLERDVHGEPVRFLGVLQDITDQELASQSVRDSEERFRGAFEGSGIGMALIDASGNYVQVNGAMCRMLGYEQAGMVGRSVSDFVHDADVEANRARIHELREGGRSPHIAEIRYRHRDGHLVWGRLHVSVITGGDGQLRYFVSQVEDITNSRVAVADLVASEVRKAEMINAMLDGMIVIDGAGTITEFNPAATRMFGQSRLDAVGASLAELLIPIRFHDRLRRNLETGTATVSRRFELVGQRADGGEFPIELSIGRFEVEGELFFSASVRDLSDRDHLAESRVQLTQVLDASQVMLFAFDVNGTITLAEGRSLAGLLSGSAVGRNIFDLLQSIPEAKAHIDRGLAGDSYVGQIDLPAHDLWLELRYAPILDSSNRVVGITGMAADISDRIRGQAARQDSDAKSQLVAVVNHEIRTPLNSILGFAELLQQPRIGPLNEKQARYILNVETAGRHLLALVNDSLDLSKMAAGEMGLQVVDLPLAEVIEQAAGQVQPLVESQGLDIRVNSGGDLGVRGDRRRLLQILWNLLSNAIRHTPTGGVISVSGAATESGIAIVVTDTGVGIPVDQLERIFEDYKQVGVGYDGTGLGLPVSRRLAQLMNGDISVVSQVGVGSAFTVSLSASSVRVASGC